MSNVFKVCKFTFAKYLKVYENFLNACIYAAPKYLNSYVRVMGFQLIF